MTTALNNSPRVGRELGRAVAAAGGSLAPELETIIATAAAINAWPAPEPTDINALARNGTLTAATAAEILDAALIQPNRTPADIRAAAADGLTKRFRTTVRDGAGDTIIESLQKPFTVAVKKIEKASQLISPEHRAEHVITIDGGPQAWAALAQAADELDRIAAVVDRLIGTQFEVLGSIRPWHRQIGGDVHRACMFAPTAGDVPRVVDVLSIPSNAARARRWHFAASTVTLNTPTVARQIHDELAQADADATKRQYEATHA
ncbi:hypothetical protein NGTWS0302_24080 [Mycolicibacterium cyprinidarum]|nr:hypothetical protein NGTWS0302_24080 [Mycolicibacterium sp. NGTWS0302]